MNNEELLGLFLQVHLYYITDKIICQEFLKIFILNSFTILLIYQLLNYVVSIVLIVIVTLL